MLTPLTEAEARDILNRKALLYVIGRIEYSDEFRFRYWTDFCRAISDDPENGTSVKYNAVGGN